MNGAALALEEQKTLLGKEIQFVPLDDKGDITEAVNAYNKLVSNEGAISIIGAVTSKPSAAVASESLKKGIPVITPTGTAVNVTEVGANVFRACYIDPFQGQVMANFSYDELNVKTAAVIYNSASDYSIGLAESFKATFEANGGTIVSYEPYGDKDIDFKSQLTNISAKSPEVLFVPDYYEKVALIAKQVKDIGFTTILLGADGWDSVLNVLEDPSLLEGAYFCNHNSNDDPDPLVQAFITNYKAKYGEDPNTFAALGYDAAKVTIAAIEKANKTDPAAIVEAMKNTDITALTGKITFDEYRNPIKGVTILKISNGKYNMFTKLNPK
jgi:branched-chain amino acid transport system substrate-binding protein